MKVRRKIRVEGKSEFGVSSDVLVEILEESIWIFWRFIRADKDANNSIQKARKAFRPELQDPADSELFSELQATLQKARTRNSITKHQITGLQTGLHQSALKV